MHASADRLEFAPPPQPGPVRAFVLAVIAHVLLMLALTWGINWNREAENQAAEAELWSSVPQQAAPKLVEVPQPPPPPPVEKKVEATPPPPAPTVKEPDIALEREKKKQQLVKQRQEELEKLKKIETKKRLEEEKRELLAEKKEAEERKKKEELAKAAKTKKQQLDDEKKLAASRAEQMRRIQGLAGATGGPTATGTAQRSAGPSSSYAGRIAALIKSHTRFLDVVSGDPPVEVEIRLAPDGTIVGQRIVKSSGNKTRDDAVLRGIEATEKLPRDVEGRIHTPMIISVRQF